MNKDKAIQDALIRFNKQASRAAANVFSPNEYGGHLTLLKDIMEEIFGRSLIADQRLTNTKHAQAVANSFLCSIVIELDKNKISWKDRERVHEFLSERFCPRKIIIAAGKSSRLSPTELIHKQILTPDRFSTNIRLSRCAASFGHHKDVVVIDSVTAYHIFASIQIENSVKTAIIEKTREQFRKLCNDMEGIQDTLQKSCEKIICRIKERLIFARTPTNQNDAAEVFRQIRNIVFEAIPDHARSDYVLNEAVYPIFRELAERSRYIDAPRCQELLGGDCIIALAKPYGPGEAYMAAVRRLQELDTLSDSKYTMPVYNEYAAAILSCYPNIYFHSFLIACNLFNFNGTSRFILDDFPVITIGSKSPRDKVEDRGNILLTDSQDGLLPTALKEWRDMTDAERNDARRRFKESIKTGRDVHAINAGVFVIDTAWAVRQFPLLPDHPDDVKGKIHEYWYTDLVQLAWSQYVEARAKNKEQNPLTRIVFFGARSPLGSKDVKSTLTFARDFHTMIRDKLLELGIFVDHDAKISIRPSPVHHDERIPDSFEKQIAEIFGSEVGGEKVIDQIYLLGDIYLDATVRIRNGTVLDGREEEVVLIGSTFVGEGVSIKGVKASNSIFADISGCQNSQTLDGFSYNPPNVNQKGWEAAAVIDSKIENCYVEYGSRIVRSTISNSHIAGRIIDSEIQDDIVARDEEVEDVTHKRRKEKLSLYVENPDDYVPGAVRPCELDEKNRKGILEFIRTEITNLYDDIVPELSNDLSETDKLFRNESLVTHLTPEQIYRYAFGRIRFFSTRNDPFKNEKQRGQEVVRQFARKHINRVLELDLANEGSREFFRHLAILTTKANFLDWQSKSARAVLSEQRFFDDFEPNLEKFISPTLAIDDLAVYEDIVFSEPCLLLYLTDNAVEAELDAVMWLLLCRLRHRVIVAAKAKPIRGDATATDILSIVNAIPALKPFHGKGKLRVIDTGSDTYGILFDKTSREFELAFTSAKAMIIKGQANLYTTAARNKVKIPIVTKLLSKGMTAQRITGVPSEDGGDSNSATAAPKLYHPIIAFIPYGERITNALGKGIFEGKLADLSARGELSS